MTRIRFIARLLVYIICVCIVSLAVENAAYQLKNVFFLRNLRDQKINELNILNLKKEIEKKEREIEVMLKIGQTVNIEMKILEIVEPSGFYKDIKN